MRYYITLDADAWAGKALALKALGQTAEADSSLRKGQSARVSGLIPITSQSSDRKLYFDYRRNSYRQRSDHLFYLRPTLLTFASLLIHS